MQFHWREGTPSQSIDLVTEFRLSYSEKAVGTGGENDVWWSALVYLKDTSIAAFNDSLNANSDDNYLLPSLYFEGPEGNTVGEHIITLFARAEVLEVLNNIDNAFGVHAIRLGTMVPKEALNSGSKEPLSSGVICEVPDDAVTMGVIDDGIAFAHNLFRQALTKSRVESMLIMDLKGLKEGSEVPSGQELFRPEINKLLKKNTYSGLLDEASFYHQAGMTSFARMKHSSVIFRGSHGTHVMGLAAGYEMGTCAPDKRPILAVQLPPRVTADTSGQSLAPSLSYALSHILHRSRCIRLQSNPEEYAPLVVNFSYGEHGGPHDGTGTISHLIDKKLNEARRRYGQEVSFVLPAGNANLAQCHAVAAFDDDCGKDRVTLDLNVLPDDHTCSFVEMWMPHSACSPPPDFVKVRVALPDGLWSGIVEAKRGSRQVLHNSENQRIGELSYSFRTKNNTDRGVILLKLHPTTNFDPKLPLAPSGRWKIEIEKADISTDQRVEVWIRRDETLPGYPPFGRQAYFDNADYVKFDQYGAPLAVDPPDSDSPIRRAGTLNGFACGDDPVVIGGLTRSNGYLSDYSAAGSLGPDQGDGSSTQAGPDASARSDDSPVLRGVISAGTCSGSMVRMNGTSVAAPLVARFIAEAYEKGETPDRDWIAERAAESDMRFFPQPKPAENRTGGGRLKLANPFREKAFIDD